MQYEDNWLDGGEIKLLSVTNCGICAKTDAKSLQTLNRQVTDEFIGMNKDNSL